MNQSPAPEGISQDLWLAVRAAPLWAGATDDALEWLSRTASVVDFAKGETFFHQGSVPESAALVIDGHGRAVNSRGRWIVSVETYWPGEVIGALASLTGILFESDIEAATQMRVALIPVASLKDLLASEPSVAMSVIAEMARRWIATVNVAKRSALDVTQRIAEYLNELPHTRLGGAAYSVELPVSRTELAALIGTAPETLSRAFHALEEAGVIEAHDRMIIVLDSEALLNFHRGRGEIGEPKNPR